MLISGQPTSARSGASRSAYRASNTQVDVPAQRSSLTLFGLLANILPAGTWMKGTERPHLVGQVPEVDAEPFGHPGDELAFRNQPAQPSAIAPAPAKGGDRRHQARPVRASHQQTADTLTGNAHARVGTRPSAVTEMPPSAPHHHPHHGGWARRVSNPRPLVCKTRALPLSYARATDIARPPEAGYLADARVREIPQNVSEARASVHTVWSRASPGLLALAKRTMPARSMTKVPRLANPAAALNTRRPARPHRAARNHDREREAALGRPDLVGGRPDGDRQRGGLVVVIGGRLSRTSSSSPWQMPVKASGKNTSSTFFLAAKSLSVTGWPFWSLRVKSGASVPTATVTNASPPPWI